MSEVWYYKGVHKVKGRFWFLEQLRAIEGRRDVDHPGNFPQPAHDVAHGRGVGGSQDHAQPVMMELGSRRDSFSFQAPIHAAL